MLIHAERFRYIENIVNIVFFCLFYKFLTNKHEVGSFVFNIANLERLILISNVSTFRFEDESLIPKEELSHHGISKWNQTSPLLCIMPEISAWFWDLQHKIALNSDSYIICGGFQKFNGENWTICCSHFVTISDLMITIFCNPMS